MAEGPTMSEKERAMYSKMQDTMNYFHNHFRSTWRLMHDACEEGQRPANMSIKQFLNVGAQFCQQLEMHHSIEEQHIFPVLAQKMPVFKREMELLTQHKQIHVGLDKLEAYISDCKASKRELRLDELKTIMDGFGEVLWQHLDDEVKQLAPENLKQYWSMDEMRRMPL